MDLGIKPDRVKSRSFAVAKHISFKNRIATQFETNHGTLMIETNSPGPYKHLRIASPQVKFVQLNSPKRICT